MFKCTFWDLFKASGSVRRTMAMSKQQLSINNFIFMDIETTGLPSEENNRTRITELCLTIVESKHIGLGVYPRVRNKLNICFNPYKMISPTVTEITGLANEMVENQSTFSSDVVSTINEFLNLQKRPICFVAHNGNRFDYPILRAEINRAESSLPQHILCIDSLLCFQDLHRIREEQNIQTVQSIQPNHPIEQPEFSGKDEVDRLDSKKLKLGAEVPIEFTDDFDELLCSAVDEYENNIKKQNIQKFLETTPKKQIFRNPPPIQEPRRNIYSLAKTERTSFKLCDIYKRLTSKDPENTHHAEGDVDCLIHCAAVYGEEFVQWANNNARLFSDIPPMKAGTKIGF